MCFRYSENNRFAIMHLIIKEYLPRTTFCTHHLLSYYFYLPNVFRHSKLITPRRETQKYRGNAEKSDDSKKLSLSLSLSFSNLPRVPNNPTESACYDGLSTATAFVLQGIVGTSRKRGIGKAP